MKPIPCNACNSLPEIHTSDRGQITFNHPVASCAADGIEYSAQCEEAGIRMWNEIFTPPKGAKL